MNITSIQAMYNLALTRLNPISDDTKITIALQKALNSLISNHLKEDGIYGVVTQTMITTVNQDAILDKFLKELILLVIHNNCIKDTLKREYVEAIFDIYEQQYDKFK